MFLIPKSLEKHLEHYLEYERHRSVCRRHHHHHQQSLCSGAQHKDRHRQVAVSKGFFIWIFGTLQTSRALKMRRLAVVMAPR